MDLETDVSLTYSPAVTLVPTNECFNRCTYCNFRRDPGTATWLSLEAAQQQLEQLQDRGVSEILILSGEVHPKSARRRAWFEHIYQLCQLVLNAGFLPHSNVGPLAFAEMDRLGQVNVSMGLMLEQCRHLPIVHADAPSKDPHLRIQQLKWAGELQIPFTTGLLLGIGETVEDWRESLHAIASIHNQWGHIQEVILQPYQPGSHETHLQEGCQGDDLVKAVKLARSILPETIAIQIPPNLIAQPDTLNVCLDLGVRDLGGIVPHDFVNPDYEHPPFAVLAARLKQWGYTLQPRLPIYEQYYSKVSESLQRCIAPWINGHKPWGYAAHANHDSALVFRE